MLLVCREEGLAVKSGRERLGQRGGDTKLALWMSIGVHIEDLWAIMLFRTGYPIASVTNRETVSIYVIARSCGTLRLFYFFFCQQSPHLQQFTIVCRSVTVLSTCLTMLCLFRLCISRTKNISNQFNLFTNM